MEFFKRMGDTVARRWKACDYDERLFPEIATEALAEYPPCANVGLGDIVRWATVSDGLPFQIDIEAKFGDPPLTVYIGRGFRIEVLFWLSGTPAIHQHSFSGAFHVMQGSSIHSIWTFEPTERLETRLLIGDVTFRDVEVLRRGDTRQILAGDEMYHATFHIDRPSISVVVRTTSEVDKFPQYSLLPPAIAHASQQEIPTLQRQIQLMKMLIKSKNRTEHQELAKHLFATKDALTIYETVMATHGLIEDEEEREDVLEIARAKHPRLIEVLERVLTRERARQRLLHLHRSMTSPDLKYFVALLLNVPDGIAMMELIERRYPMRSPVDAVMGWARELSQQGALGLELPEPWLPVLESMLPISSVEGAISTSTSESGWESDVREIARAIRGCWLLGSLFRRELRPHTLHRIPRLRASLLLRRH